MSRKPTVNVFETKPADFSPQVEVVACYLEIGGALLLLQRASACKSEPNTWTVPAGKLEPSENPLEAAKRELFEETGIVETREDRWKYCKTLYIRKPGLDYIYHLFEVRLDEAPVVRLSPREHQAYRWVKVNEVEKMDLILGAREVLMHHKLKARNGYS